MPHLAAFMRSNPLIARYKSAAEHCHPSTCVDQHSFSSKRSGEHRNAAEKPLTMGNDGEASEPNGKAHPAWGEEHREGFPGNQKKENANEVRGNDQSKQQQTGG